MGTLLKSGSEIKVLVVVDASDNLRVLAKMLEAHHYLVSKALNGEIAKITTLATSRCPHSKFQFHL